MEGGDVRVYQRTHWKPLHRSVADDCKNGNVGNICCCGQCLQSPWVRLACVLDPSANTGKWQPKDSLCLVDCGSMGVVSSPNFPENYPNLIEKIEMIQVDKEHVVELQFTDFNLLAQFRFDYSIYGYDYDTITYCYDILTIIDGDGTTLWGPMCGNSLPPIITSNSNIVKLEFRTGELGGIELGEYGWSATWTAVTPGPRVPVH